MNINISIASHLKKKKGRGFYLPENGAALVSVL
jgi:hypothetical protein